MKPLSIYSIILPLVLLLSCSTSEQATELTLPELIHLTPLPAYPRPISTASLRIPLRIHVTKEGTVGDVILLKSSGSAEWDTAAVAAIRQWRYSPARSGLRPVNIWLHQTAVVKFSEPFYLTLAEIICASADKADSAFLLLEQGAEFSEIVTIFSDADSRDSSGVIGRVNAQCYPEPVKNVLMKLGPGQYSKPTRIGDHYAIYKRLHD